MLVIHFREGFGVAQAQNVFGVQQMNDGVSLISSADFPTSRHLIKTVNGHLLSLYTDETGDVSMEVIGFVPNQPNVQRQPPGGAQFRTANSFQNNGAGQGMTQMTNMASARTNFASPRMNQFAGENVQQTQTGGSPNEFNVQQTQMGGSLDGFSAPVSFGVAGSASSGNPNFQQEQPGPQSNEPPFMNNAGGDFGNQPNSQSAFNEGPGNFPDNSQTPSQKGGPQNPIAGFAGNSNFQQQPGPQPQQPNGPPFMNGGPANFPVGGRPPVNPQLPNQIGPQNPMGGVAGNFQQQPGPQPQQTNGPPFMNGGPVNPQMPSQIGGTQNSIGGIVPSITSGIGHLFRDSDEFQDISVERDLVLGQDGRLQTAITISRDSAEYDDSSLEVNLNLLPRLRTLLNSQLVTQHQQVNNNPRMVFFQHDDYDNDLSLEYQDILASPVFQQQIQEIDVRLKRAPAARSKRLMEKYAQALALSSSTATPATMNTNSLFCFSLLITWISVWLVL